MNSSTVESDPCNIKEVPIQRWVCVTIVSSGAVLDVYMDGKLARSCVLDNVVEVPRQQLALNLADQTGVNQLASSGSGPTGGFGGRISSVQMWGQQLTPDVIYGIYQMGPTQTQHSIFTDFAKYFNLNVSFTGSAPGQPLASQANINPFGALYNQGSQTVQNGYGQVSNLTSSLTGN